MSFKALSDVYTDQLKDLYSANCQALPVTRRLQTAADDPQLKKALQNGAEGVERGLETLASLVREQGADPDETFCRGMEGIADEAEAHAIDAQFDVAELRDAMIVTQYQRMTHYAMAGYGCCMAFARRLGLAAQAEQLKLCLDGTHKGDIQMMALAAGKDNVLG